MKSYFPIAGLFTCLCAAQAHESWAPHTHTLDQQQSDVVVLALGVLAAAGAGWLLSRLFRKRCATLLSGSVRRTVLGRLSGAPPSLDDQAE